MYFPDRNYFVRTYGTSTPRQRPHNGDNKARYPTQIGKPTKLSHALQHQPQNGGQVEQVPHRPGYAQGA